MPEFPARITVGVSPYQSLYVLQSELLLRFDEQTSERVIDRILKARNLKWRSGASFPRGTDTLSAAKMRWVVTDQTDSLSGLARQLVGSIKELISAQPVYYVDGQGAESAASPMPDVVVVQMNEKDRKRTLRHLRQLGLIRNGRMSDLLKPLDYFDIGSGNDDKGDDDPPDAFDLVDRAAQTPGVEMAELDWLKLETYLLVPNDTQWANQWNMAQIGLVNAWDVQTGVGTVWLAIIDSGFDLAHPDLAFTPNAGGTLTHFDAGQAILGNPPPYNAGSSGVFHGTAVAGLAGASLNNSLGVAGVAGGCSIMPVRLGTVPTATRVAAGLNWAAANGASVASLSLGTTNTVAAATAVANAWAAGLVICAATGNAGGNTTSPPVNFPANHANVIAVGASDQNDQRKRPASADGECWGSNFGAQTDVLAPGVRCWTTDEQGASGYNNNNGGAISWACVNYASSGDAVGDYFAIFDGTSAATPHVAGLAGLLFSEYPALTNQQVRDVIERTCTKVNPAMYAYANVATRPNGTWHQEVGHGRINCDAALNYADIMISDHDLDTGAVPSSQIVGGSWSPKAFWGYQPYVTQTSQPAALPANHEPAKANQDNFVHAYVTNLGPGTASNIQLTWHIMDYPGTQLIWPTDWNAANQIASATVTSLAAGASVAVEATWPQALVNIASAYVHPCMVVQATCAQDVGGDLGTRVYEYNNIAQHNISFAAFSAPGAGANARTFTLPFAVGHASIARARLATLDFDLKRAGEARVFVDLDPRDDLPYVETIRDVARKFPPGHSGGDDCGITLMKDTRLIVNCCGCRAEVHVKAGSAMRMLCGESTGRIDLKHLNLRNATRVEFDGRPQLLLSGSSASMDIALSERQVVPVAMTVVAPENAAPGSTYRVDVTQSTDGAGDGGVSLEVRATT